MAEEEDPLGQAKRDLIIGRRVVAALKQRKIPSLRNLRVESEIGTVTLSGTVYSFYDKQVSCHAARMVSGVTRVIDRIEVGPAPTFKDPQSISRAAISGIALLLVVGVVALTATSLRGADGRLPTFPVRGRILFNDQPVAGANVMFFPTTGGNDAPRPRGKVDKRGYFTLTTYETADGSPQGEFLVTVEWPQTVGEGDDAHFVNALAPEYSAPKTSKLKAVIREQSENLVQFALTGNLRVALNVGNNVAAERKEVHVDERLNLGD